MSHLLDSAKFDPKAVRKGATPLMLEFPVSGETAPYLVLAATDRVLWIERPHGSDPIVKSAVRSVPSDEVYRMVVEAVVERGLAEEWGNVHPATEAGIGAAIAHVEHYDLTDLEALVPQPPGDIKAAVATHGLAMRPCSWMPEGYVVIVPKDRSFVGVLATLGKKVAVVVHNPARAIGVARP